MFFMLLLLLLLPLGLLVFVMLAALYPDLCIVACTIARLGVTTPIHPHTHTQLYSLYIRHGGS